MIIATAQTRPVKADISKNLEDHYKLVNLASKNEVQLIVFPELSITGYETELANKLSFSVNDSRLDKLRRLAVDNNIIIIAGAPIKIIDDLYIGSFIIFPDSSISMYIKQFLASVEKKFYKSSFDFNPTIKLDNERISLAICADITNSQHAYNAYIRKSSIYIASIFYTPEGIDLAYFILGNYAKKYSMNVLMSNYCGPSWHLDSGGKSAFWNKNGELVANMDEKKSGLLIITRYYDTWTGKIL